MITGGSLPSNISLSYGLDADKPTNPKRGEAYISTDVESFNICAKDGEWDELKSTSDIYREVQRLDKKVWNTASELMTFALSGCAVVDESIALGVYDSLTCNYPNPDYTWSSTTSAMRKIPFVVIADNIASIKLQLSSRCSNITKGYILDESDNILVEGNFSSGICILDYPFVNGVNYKIGADNNGGTFTGADYHADTHPFGNSHITFNGTGYAELFDEVYTTQNIGNPLSGYAVTPLISNADLSKWEFAYFDIDPDGESITVDVLNSADTVLLSDISDGDSLKSIASTESIKLKFNISRSSTSKNPKVHNAVVKWINILTSV